MKRNMTTLIIATVAVARIAWLGLLWWTKPREATFYIHYQRPYGQYARSVTVRSSSSIIKFPKVFVQQPDDIRSEKVWFTDRKGHLLDSREELQPLDGKRMWLVAIKP